MSSPERLQMLLKKALKLHREGRIAMAEACYRKIQKVDPDCPEARELASLFG